MPDDETIPRRTRSRPNSGLQHGSPGRFARRLANESDVDPVSLRREVVVQGMRITLPALRFMDRPAPSGGRSG